MFPISTSWHRKLVEEARKKLLIRQVLNQQNWLRSFTHSLLSCSLSPHRKPKRNRTGVIYCGVGNFMIYHSFTHFLSVRIYGFPVYLVHPLLTGCIGILLEETIACAGNILLCGWQENLVVSWQMFSSIGYWGHFYERDTVCMDNAGKLIMQFLRKTMGRS